MKRTFRSLLCLVLTVSMLFAVAAVSVSAGKAKIHTSHLETLGVADEEEVRAIVVLEGDAVVDLDVDPQSEAGVRHERSLLSMQAKFLRKAGNLEAAYHYTELFNGVAIDVTVAELKKIEQMTGVEAVYIANTYTIPEYDTLTEEEINANWASLITGATTMNMFGYTGDGVVVAVLDTGINLEHEALQENAYIQNPALDQATVEATETTGGVYVNAKVPYSYDYYDLDTDCTDENGHGSHVSGIIGGYAEDENGNVKFAGAAPAVQLLGMKIFGATGGTNSSIYFAALEDAYRLGADAVNMSLGSPSGFTYDYTLESELYGDIYQKLDDAGIAVFCSAGNDTNMGLYGLNLASQMGYPYVLGDYMDYGVVGSPSTYPSNMSVASADNLYVPMEGISFDGATYFYYTDPNAGGELDFRYQLEGVTAGFVYVPGLGALSDYEGLDVAGKIVAVDRGEISFQEKIDNAAAMGALACIIVNNDPTPINMQVEGLTIPAIAVDMGAKYILAGMNEVTVSYGMFDYQYPTALNMSDFSSWGTTSDLQFKPQITGIGGAVYSSVNGAPDAYDIYSGTSMSCPNVTGSYAVLLQYLREVYPTESKYDLANKIEDLMLSTAYILTDDYGYSYSPRQQGAGLMDVLSAIVTPGYITNPTVSLGDDPDMTGVLEMTYEVVNLSDTTEYYYLEPTVLSDYPVSDGVNTYSTLSSSDIAYDFGWQYLNYEVSTVFSDGKTDEGAVFAIEPGDSAEVTVTITVDPAVLGFYSQYFPNGFFLEGYVNFYDYEELVSWNIGASDLPAPLFHGSYISFCGDWNAAPALEQVSTEDLVYVTAWLEESGYDPSTYLIAGLNAFGLDLNVYFNEAYLYSMDSGMYVDLGVNPFSASVKYPIADRNAFSTPLSDADLYFMDSLLMMPTVLRNCRNLIMTVTDAETGEVYYVDNTEYVAKDAADHNTGSYQHRSQFLWDGINYNTGEYVPSGTKAIITFETVLDFEGAEPKLEWVTEVTVDYTAPEIYYEYDADTMQLTVTVSDNEYLASYYAYGEYTDVDGLAYDTQTAGEGYTYVYDLTGYEEAFICLEAADFATNIKEVVVPLTYGDVSNIPVSVEVIADEGIDVEVIGDAVLYNYLEFVVSAADGYCLADAFTVKVNGEEMEPYSVSEDGEYGYVYYVESTDVITIEASGAMAHDFQPVVIQAPDCCSIGYQEYRCTNCDLLDHSEWMDPLGHTPADEYVVVSLPSCEDCIVSVLYCEVCGEIVDLISEEAPGHTVGETEIVKEPTCTTEGYAAVHCAVCDEIISVELLPANGHTAGEWETVKEATCTEAGEKVQKCAECGEVIATEAISAAGHTAGTAETILEPTCTANGSAAVHCAVCDEIISVEVLPANGHTAGEWETVKEPTYKEAGEKVQKCTECGEVVATEAIAKLEGLLGDVNADGVIDSKDYMIVKRYVLGSYTITDDEFARADVYTDGVVDARDYIVLKRIVLKGE